ncbi:ABC transporter substrate-binding protein [Streptomyces griseorubiginosus]|uniref:ABC transporter substrate-binding protein n=1 Tax=Streptomyces griseorubiginosus TaxID=67304 RepID=UPI0011407ED8|nr:ABC transporter substrate-binding protein [Streptomyces griseorubiginosus]
MTMRLRQSVFIEPPLSRLADELGCFAKAGLAVETLTITSSAQQREQLLGGEADIGMTATDNLIVWNAQGADVRVIAQFESTTLNQLVVRDSFTSVKELRGAKLGVDALDNGFSVLLRYLLRGHGLGAEDYELHPVGGVLERRDALRAGTIDGTLLGPPLDEFVQHEGFSTLIRGEDEVPDFPGQTVVAPAAVLDSASTALVRYVSALDAALRWVAETPDGQVIDLLVRAGCPPVFATTFLRTCPTSLVPPREGLERLITMRQELGMMPQPAISADDLYDPEPLTKALGT